jgi:outer membrane receptor for ferrienterochelin and colicins
MNARPKLLSIFLFGSSILLLRGIATSQGVGSLSGTVVSAEGASPLAGANVVVQRTILGATSDGRGQFSIARVPQGVYSLLISRVGYQRKLLSDISIKAGDTTTVSISLTPLPIQSEAVVVTATKHDENLQEIPVSVSIVDSKTIQERNSITIDDALRYTPGVNMVQSQVNIRGMSGYSRGIGSRVLLLLDGLPLLTGDTGEITWETIPTLQVARVEVVKGAGSALYGSSALGGVINVITRDIKEGVEGKARVYTGFYDTPYYDQWKWSDKTRFLDGVIASYAQRRGPLAFLFSGGRTNDDGYREDDFYHRWNGYGKLSYDFSAYENVTLSLNFLQQKKGSFFWWKDLEHALLSDDDQSLFHVTTTRWNANGSFRKFVSDDFFYTLKGVYFSSSLQNDSMGVLGSSSRAHTGTLEFQGNVVPASPHALTFGVVGNFDDIGSQLYGTHADFGAAAYLQVELRDEDKLRLTAGARYDFEKILGLEAANQLSPKFGVVYTPDKGTSIRASAGRGFRAPSIGEIYINAASYAAYIIPNPDLKAEHSWSYEVGGSQLLSDQVLLDGSLFWSDFSDLIEAGVEYDPDLQSPAIKFDNVTRARIQGAELSAKSDWFQKLLHLEASYTYVWPRDLTQNEVLRFRPRHLLYISGSLNYRAVSLGVDFRYISKVDRVDEMLIALAPIQDGAARVPIKVVDARASVDLTSAGVPITLRFNVNNIFQYNYVELMGNISPIRNFVLSADTTF